MGEQGESDNGQFKKLRTAYEPQRAKAGEILTSEGVSSTSTLFRKLRHRFARNTTLEQLKAESESEKDPLTGILNRRGFERKLKEEFEINTRSKMPFTTSTIVFLDVNNLKQINDADPAKHEAGDKHLQNVAKTLQENSRAIDILSRFGGDEFCLILWGTNLENIQKWWNRVNKAFNEKAISIAAGTIEINLNDTKDNILETVRELQRKADQTMYRAKKESKEKKVNILLEYDQTIEK